MLTQIAQTLEDAADFILVRGLHRGALKSDLEDQYCTIGAIYQVAPEIEEESLGLYACKALEQHLLAAGAFDHLTIDGSKSPLAEWSDTSKDDFEIIDTLRHCAKDIRNTI